VNTCAPVDERKPIARQNVKMVYKYTYVDAMSVARYATMPAGRRAVDGSSLSRMINYHLTQVGRFCARNPPVDVGEAVRSGPAALCVRARSRRFRSGSAQADDVLRRRAFQADGTR